MIRISRKYVLLLLILAFALSYRILLTLFQTFPPGADIGLHNSIIYSITQSGNTNFLWNYFHMGGEVSATFPGYHIFVAFIMLLTGMPSTVAHTVTVSLFSSLIVLVAYVITRRVWNESAALVVAFLVAVSRFDIEMLMWAGYPNVITLLLIPLAFYLFLERKRFTLVPFLATASLVSGAIFLTHSLSAILFIAITIGTVASVAMFAKKIGVQRRHLLICLAPLVIGAAIVSPFLIQVAPQYLIDNSGTFTGAMSDIRLALLATKILPLGIVIPLFFCAFIYFPFSKRYQGKFFTVPTVLLAVWLLVPAILTQGYLVGLYTDYNRFLYFVIFPVILMIGLVIYHAAIFFSEATHWLISVVKEIPQVKLYKNVRFEKAMPYFTVKNITTVFIASFLLVTFLAVPIFAVPSQAIDVATFYQTMDEPLYEGIMWAKANTPVNSKFMTDATYGWWFSGFAERPTISAVDPQYLTLANEFEPAKVARTILDTDFFVDNGLIQVREDGGYVGRHNPIFLAKLNTTDPYYSYYPYPFFHFNSSEITVMYSKDDDLNIVALAELPVIDMQIVNDTNHASINLVFGNGLFNFTETTTVYAGVQFADMSISLQTSPGVSIDIVRLILHTKGVTFGSRNAIALLDWNMKVAGQVIFKNKIPQVNNYTSDNPSCNEFLYDFHGAQNAKIDFSIGLYQFKLYKWDYSLRTNENEDAKRVYYNELIENHTRTAMNKVADLPLDVLNYRQALVNENISYIAIRSSEEIPRFAKDPFFRLVFINDRVAIFQVLKS